MEADYEKGVDLLRAGEYFAAHEALEDAWRAAPAAERDFFQGLVHVAVAWYQAGRGRRIGCERQLEKAARRLAPYAPSHRGLDVAYEAGLELIRAGEYFAAHEELEDAWRAAPAEERDFFQGLVHVAVAWYQAGRGREIGTERQLAKAVRRLEPFAPVHRGIDLEPLLVQLRELHDHGSLELPPPLV